MDRHIGPLEESGPEWFVNRKHELNRFWDWATSIPKAGQRSYALVGLRRTGKTAILHKTFNRLFNEQDKVMPVYISFAHYLYRPEPINAYEFADEYFTGYVRSYLAFQYKETSLYNVAIQLEELRAFARQKADKLVEELFKGYETKSIRPETQAHTLMQWVINFPRGYAMNKPMPTVIFIDEFQVLTRVYNPDSQMMRNLTDSFQKASETRYAPLLVSGSSISMLMGNALSGMLSGRFKHKQIGPLSESHAIQMVYRLAEFNGLEITDEFAAEVWEKTNGFPYSIECILNSDAPAAQRLPDLDALNLVVAYELTSKQGELWRHYENEYGKYVQELNGDGITRKILYWIVDHADEPNIHPIRIAKRLDLDVIQVRESLEKLYELDIIDRESVTTFESPNDPLMLEFLKSEHHMKIGDLSREDGEIRLHRELRRKQGEMNRQTGHFTELLVAGLMREFDDSDVEGETYFSTPHKVRLYLTEHIERRVGVVKEGVPHEIDLVSEYKLYNGEFGNPGKGAWFVSVRFRQQKMGEKEVEAFMHDAALLQESRQYGNVIRWYFSKAGFTTTAQARLRQEGIHFSDLAQFNLLADKLGVMQLEV